MNKNRIRHLNDKTRDSSGKYVLYWMQQSQRAHANPALEYAVRLANKQDQVLVVCFGLMPDYPEANMRHFSFMLEGLTETAESLHKRGIKFVMQTGEPDQVALTIAQQASVVVCDCGYLKHQRQWRRRVAAGESRSQRAPSLYPSTHRLRPRPDAVAAQLGGRAGRSHGSGRTAPR